MRTVLMLLMSLSLATTCLAQSSAAKWKVATITGVKVHEPVAGNESSAAQYEVTAAFRTLLGIVWGRMFQCWSGPIP
jgi:hypothetical protein